MLLNAIFNATQKIFYSAYKKSFVLQNIDWLIFLNINLVILTSAFAQSDCIGNFALFVIILTFIKFLFKPKTKLVLSGAEKFLLLYLMIVLISVAGSTLFALSLKGFSKTLVYIGFYFSFVDYLKNNLSKLKYIFLLIAGVTFIESFVALNQNFLSVSEISGWQDMSRLNPEQVMTRVYGTLKPYNPNLFGGYLLAVLPTTLFVVFLPLCNKHYKTAVFGLFMFLMALSALIMTGCRGAYIGLLFEIIVLLFISFHLLKLSYKKIFMYVSGLFCVISSMIILSMSSLRARVASIFAMRSDSSNSFRFNVYNSCIDMFKDNWLLGIGVGNQNFREIYGLYMKTGFDALSAYNIYLEIAVESGLFALIAFIAFIVSVFIKGVKFILKKPSFKSIYVIIAIISLVGLLFHGIVDTVFFRPQIQFIFWIMVGVIRVLTCKEYNYDRNRT